MLEPVVEDDADYTEKSILEMPDLKENSLHKKAYGFGY